MGIGDWGLGIGDWGLLFSFYYSQFITNLKKSGKSDNSEK